MSSSPATPELDWSTPLTVKQALALFLSCWVGLWVTGFAMVVASAFCVSYWMARLNMGSLQALPPLPGGLNLVVSWFAFDQMSLLPSYRLLVFLLGYGGMAVPLLVCCRTWQKSM